MYPASAYKLQTHKTIEKPLRCKIWNLFYLYWCLIQGMKERANLSGSQELGLKNAIAHRDNVDDYGHLVYEALLKVSTMYKVEF